MKNLLIATILCITAIGGSNMQRDPYKTASVGHKRTIFRILSRDSA